MPGLATPSTARRHATRETIDGAARRFLELVKQNPGIHRGVLADRAGSPHGIPGASVIKAAKALSVPLAEKGGAYAQAVPKERRKQAAIDYLLLVQRNHAESREELAWSIARMIPGANANAVRRWAREYGSG